ncbi:unnamed protein product, partial [Meganyctiphanes norvegica]
MEDTLENESVKGGDISIEKKANGVDLRKYSKEQLRLMKPANLTDNPFENMQIADSSFLEEVDGRVNCEKCNKSRKYFCYTCYVALPVFADRLPKVSLPCLIDIIKHPKETDGKSTAAHAGVLSPEVRIFTYPQIPDYTKESNVLLIFPDKTSVRLEELWTQLDSSPNTGLGSLVQNIAKIDSEECVSTKIRNIFKAARLEGLQCVELTSRNTLFWRYQKGKPNTYLATIEAIYYFVLDVHKNLLNQEYDGQYDNLLFFFKFFFQKIHSIHDPATLRAYKEI